MPYALAGHVHEREVTRQLGHAVEFMPHVAPHFRGLTMTANLHLRAAVRRCDEVRARYRERYAGEPLVRRASTRRRGSARIAGRHHVEIGGFTLSADGRRLVVVATSTTCSRARRRRRCRTSTWRSGCDEIRHRGIPAHWMAGRT